MHRLNRSTMKQILTFNLMEMPTPIRNNSY